MTSSQLELLSRRYNEALGYSWERVVDFIKLHYCISDREDSQFWLDNKRSSTLSDRLLEQLEVWRQFSPAGGDFVSKLEVFNAENFLYVLYGMHYGTAVPVLTPNGCDQSLQWAKGAKLRAEQLLKELPEHRALLEKISKYGLQKV